MMNDRDAFIAEIKAWEEKCRWRDPKKEFPEGSMPGERSCVLAVLDKRYFLVYYSRYTGWRTLVQYDLWMYLPIPKEEE